jgi:hypothetical protein
VLRPGDYWSDTGLHYGGLGGRHRPSVGWYIAPLILTCIARRIVLFCHLSTLSRIDIPRQSRQNLLLRSIGNHPAIVNDDNAINQSQQ